MYIEFLKEDREVIQIPIDEIYCKHESNYAQYRNNYRNQLKSIKQFPEESIKNDALTAVLKEQGFLYPIALYTFEKGYMCVDGHHRIKAYLTLGYDKLPGIIYKDKEESLKAKSVPYKGERAKS